MSSSSNNERQENNNNNNNGNNNNRQQVNNNNNRADAFTGSCPEMRGYTITSKNAGPNSSQFLHFSKALINMAGRFGKDPRFIKSVVEHGKDPTIPNPMSFSDIQEEIKKQFGGKIPDPTAKLEYSTFERLMSKRMSDE